MTDSALVQVLLYGHIVAAMGTLGGSLLFAFAIGPLLPRLTPATRAEVVVKVLPRIAAVIGGFGGLVALFGVALALAITGGDLSQFSNANPWGQRISVGIVFGLAALLVAYLWITPAVRELARIQAGLPADGSARPPPRFLVLMQRVQIGAVLSEITMLAAIAFMVAAAEL